MVMWMQVVQSIVIFLICLTICVACTITLVLHIFHMRLSILKRNLFTYLSFLLIHLLNSILVTQVGLPGQFAKIG